MKAPKISSSTCEWLIKALEPKHSVEARRMFGGHGVYCNDTMFAIVDDEVLYFKVNESSRAKYTAEGSDAFRPYADKSRAIKTYYEVPANVIDNVDELVKWASEAIEAARSSRKR